MDKKGQTTIGQILVGIVLFVFLLMGSFTFFAGHMAQNNVEFSGHVNETEFNAQFDRFQSEFNETAGEVDTERDQTPNILGLEFLATGIDSLKAAWDSIDFALDYMSFARKNSALDYILPSPFWSILGAILTIILVLIVLGALWRYPLTK